MNNNINKPTHKRTVFSFLLVYHLSWNDYTLAHYFEKEEEKKNEKKNVMQ